MSDTSSPSGPSFGPLPGLIAGGPGDKPGATTSQPRPPKARAKAKPKPRRPKTPFVRLLPALIFVAALMLSLRMSDIWKGALKPESFAVAELQAQQPVKPTQVGGPQPQQLAQGAPAAKPEPARQPDPAGGPGSSGGAGSAAAEQANLTQSEMDVLQRLADRRAALDLREQDIVRREVLLKAAENQIDRKISEMKTLQNTIEGLLRQYNEQEDGKMRSLVKIYENMKPKEAAKIFEQLDMNILLEVVERMKEQRVAPIMAEMDPSKAKTVTSELAQRRQMPLPKPASGG